MAKRPSTLKNVKPEDEKKSPLLLVSIAIIGFLGTIIAALVTGYFGILAVRTQIDRPIILTQTAQIINPVIPADASPLTPTKGPYNWETILDVTHLTPCPALFFPDYFFNNSDKVKWFQENAHAMYNQQELMYSPDVTLVESPNFYVHLTITNTSSDQDWVKLDKDVTVSVRFIEDAPEIADILNIQSCGGGGYIRKFSPISLSSDYDRYDIKSVSTDADYYTLHPGEFEIFEMHFKCESPGIYQTQFDVPITYKGERGTMTYAGIAGFICPKNLNYYLGGPPWENDPGIPIYEVKEFEWTGSDYEEVLP